MELRLIQPSKPRQNRFIESFNGRFRDECLNEHGFSDINIERTHQGKMCCDRTPMETLLDGKGIWVEKNLSQM